jgi:protein SCO1/2
MKGKKTLHGARRVVAAGLLAATLVPMPALTRAEEGNAALGEKDVKSGPVQVRLFDTPLLDQDGKKVRFASEAVGEKVVVVDTFFTTCTLICPILGAIFSDLQDQMGDRLGREVRLISITVDPGTDIPPRLKKYAEQWEAKPGWLFLTGGKKDVDQVLEGLGLYSADFTDHPSTFLVGDGRDGKWTRFYGFATPEQLMGKVGELLEGRKAKGR